MVPYLLQVSASNDTTQWIVMGAAVFGLAYILLRPRFGRRKDPLENSAPRFSLAQQRSLERDMNNVVVELAEMARQITGQLDTRAARLEALITEADEKIRRLEQVSGGKTDESSLRRSTGLSDADAPASLGENQSNSAAASPDRTTDTIAQRHAQIYALADQGLDARSIAHKLERPDGEIELILALRKPSQNGQTG